MTLFVVCGGREWDDADKMGQVLKHWADNVPPILTVWAGGARGADRMAESWAIESGLPFTPWPAEWHTPTGQYDKRAGYRRNELIANSALAHGDPQTLCLAFKDGFKGMGINMGGTEHMVTMMHERGFPCFVYSHALALDCLVIEPGPPPRVNGS